MSATPGSVDGSPTPHQITLVQQSFAKVEPISEQAAVLFYDRLFELDPALKPMFKGDMAEQRRKLMATLGVAVKGLTRPETIIPVVKQLGVRHIGFGVREAHYDTVGAALLWALEQGLGDQFTDEVKDAWGAVYTLVAGVMKQAARQAQQAA